MKRPNILVVGSINMDLFMEGATRLPKYGETIRCRHYGYASGGKGSNQAVAVAKQGADATFVGCVGQDDYGKKVMAALRESGVNTDYVMVDPETQTGFALMLIDDKTSRYVSYMTMGGNDKVSPDAVKKALDENEFDMVIMQLEIPLETVYRTYELAKEKGIPVFLDAGPAMNIPLERLKGIFIISPNEAETEALTGIRINTKENAIKAAKWLYEEAEPHYVILKMGEQGALLYDGKEAKFIECFKVKTVDTTAAGDTFGAALAIHLCRGNKIEDAILYAHAAAGISVSRLGAQTSIPTEEEVDAFLKERIGGSL